MILIGDVRSTNSCRSTANGCWWIKKGKEQAGRDHWKKTGHLRRQQGNKCSFNSQSNNRCLWLKRHLNFLLLFFHHSDLRICPFHNRSTFCTNEMPNRPSQLRPNCCCHRVVQVHICWLRPFDRPIIRWTHCPTFWAATNEIFPLCLPEI